MAMSSDQQKAFKAFQKAYWSGPEALGLQATPGAKIERASYDGKTGGVWIRAAHDRRDPSVRRASAGGVLVQRSRVPAPLAERALLRQAAPARSGPARDPARRPRANRPRARLRRRHRRGRYGPSVAPLSLGRERASTEVPHGEVRGRVGPGERMAGEDHAPREDCTRRDGCGSARGATETGRVDLPPVG